MEYQVIWGIDLEADTPLDAALIAEAIQHDQVLGIDGAERGCFVVIDSNGIETRVDLAEQDLPDA